MALIQIEFKDEDFKEIMEDLHKAEELTLKAYRKLSSLGVVSVEKSGSQEEKPD